MTTKDGFRSLAVTCLRSTSLVAAHVAPDCQVTPPLAATIIVIASLWHGKCRFLQQPHLHSLRKTGLSGDSSTGCHPSLSSQACGMESAAACFSRRILTTFGRLRTLIPKRTGSIAVAERHGKERASRTMWLCRVVQGAHWH